VIISDPLNSDMCLKAYCENIRKSVVQDTNNCLDVYYGTTESFLKMVPAFYLLLSDYEKTRADRFKYESDYNCYISVHALLRKELSKILNKNAKSLKIGESKYGKPYLIGVNLPFSISKTKYSFAFAIGKAVQYLGIDIEQIKPDLDFISVAKNYFSNREQQLIFSMGKTDDQKRTFFELWTRKEAVLKAIGIGLNTELNEVNVLDGDNFIGIKKIKIKVSHFWVKTTAFDRLIMSIASSNEFDPKFIDLSLYDNVYSKSDEKLTY
jgi:4'-phosphopantetheinyl transferase